VNRRYVTGLASVEFAIVGMMAMVVLFAVLEVGRALFVFNALEEATRRGARMAAVCPLNDPAIAEVAMFGQAGGGGASPLLSGLDTGNVALEYLNGTGGIIGDPAGNYAQIRFVRVRIDDFQHRLIIPLFGTTFDMPGFETTLPRESLGVSREAVRAC
jgi:hypothetical protein